MRIPGPLVVATVTGACGWALMSGIGEPGGTTTAVAGASGYGRVATEDCNDWNASRASRRVQLVSEMGDHFGHKSHIWEGAKLPDGEARRIIQRACEDTRASDIKLYKIYSRALTYRAYARITGS